MHAVGIWCKTKIQIDPGGLEVNFSLQARLSGFILFIISLIYYFAYSIILLVLLFDTGLREND